MMEITSDNDVITIMTVTMTEMIMPVINNDNSCNDNGDKTW